MSCFGTCFASLRSASASRIGFTIVCGTIPWTRLNSSCICRRRSVSASAFLIEFVMTSAYRTTRESAFRAARPIVWIRDRASRRNPSLSASRIPMNPTSGMSSPSRRRLIPTRTSNRPSRSAG